MSLNRLQCFTRLGLCRAGFSNDRWMLSILRHIHSSGSQSKHLDILQLKERGIFENIFPDTRLSELKTLLEKPQGVYCGFDPTADSLHIGNLISLTALLHAQRAGHSPIAVLGGATASVGDPSGKQKERPEMPAEDIDRNMQGIRNNVERIVNNHRTHFMADGQKLPEFRILNNADWYKDTNFISFLTSNCRSFRLGEMISRHSVQSRLSSKEGISLVEFMYQVVQASDWLHLYREYGCTLQIGGGDQQGNMASGFDLIHKKLNKFAFALTTPLLLSASGEKLGKSVGNAIWLNPERTSAYDFYQYFINLPDSEVETYLKLFTFYSNEELEQIIAEHKKSPEKRHGQTKLAETLTLLVHGEADLSAAKLCTELFFRGSLSTLQALNEPQLSQVMKTCNGLELTADSTLTVLRLADSLYCFTSQVEARRIIKAGGFYINQQRVTDPDYKLADGDYMLDNRLSLVRAGKKSYHLVKWRW